MAGSGHNHQQIKYSYFHHQNSPVHAHQTSSVCTSTHLDQSMMSSSTSPWYHPSAISGDNDDSLLTFMMEQRLPREPLTTMNRPPSIIILKYRCRQIPIQQLYENYGHFFVKKTFHKADLLSSLCGNVMGFNRTRILLRR